MQKTAYEMRISDWSSDVCSSDLLCDRHQILDDFLALRRRDQTSALIAKRGILCLCRREKGGFARPFRLVGLIALPHALRHVARLEGMHFGRTSGRTEIGRASCRERVCQSV